MAEFVNKGALMEAYEKLPIQKTAEVDCGDGFRNRPLVDLALVYEMICSQPTTTEAELRANVIDEFAGWCYINGIDFSYMAKGTDKKTFVKTVIERFNSSKMKGEKE